MHVRTETEAFTKEKERWGARLKERPVPPAATDSGLELQALYTPEDIADLDYLRDLGFPGQHPFTRGIYPSMYRGNLWTMRMYSGFGTAEDSNARYKYLLQQGQTGLSVAFDLPSQLGYDPDHPDMEDEVGRVGVSIASLADMEVLFDGIPLDKISTNFTINATSGPILAMYIAVGEKQGVPARQLTGTLQNDLLKDYAARGTWIFPVEPSLRLTVDIIEYASQETPRFNPISISAAHMREAGASAAESVAYAFANALVYIERTLQRGLDIDQFAPRLSFNLGITLIDFFEEIAKYRAARRLWAKLIKERFHPQDPRSCMLRMYAGSGGSSLTAQEPLNNIIRVAYEALAAVLGGVQALHCASYDEAYAIPTEESVRLALRTQQILAYETGVAQVIDPLAGCYFVEALTNRMEQEIGRIMAEIEDKGGIVSAIESGYLQRRILNRAYEEERKIQSGEKVVVGLNKFQGDGPQQPIEIYQPDPTIAQRQMERLRQVKAQRDTQRVRQSLKALRQAAEGTATTMPYILEAVRAYATIGEISEVLRQVWGEFQEPVAL